MIRIRAKGTAAASATIVIRRLHVSFCLLALALGCGGRTAAIDDRVRFAPCPASPNCVSSDASDETHAIDAYLVRGEARAAWKALGAHLRSLPRVEIETDTETYLHAVFTTRLMRYRDDVEFRLDAATGRIRVRSASRVGYGDMGANRDRIEAIRAALAARGVIEPAAAR